MVSKASTNWNSDFIELGGGIDRDSNRDEYNIVMSHDVSYPFQVVSDYEPAGDQPTAIQTLVEGVQAGLAHQTLLGVTGSGKTFTVAKVIESIKRPTIVMAHNKTLAAQLYGVQRVFSSQCGRVFRVLLRLLPT